VDPLVASWIIQYGMYYGCIILAPTGDGGSKVQDMATCAKPHRG